MEYQDVTKMKESTKNTLENMCKFINQHVCRTCRNLSKRINSQKSYLVLISSNEEKKTISFWET